MIKKKVKQRLIGISLGVAVILIVFVLSSTEFLKNSELKFLDLRFQFRGERTPSSDVVIIAIDEASFSEFKMTWPWPRKIHSELIEKLFHSGARVIAFDLIFSEPSREYPLGQDELLASAAKRAGNVVWGSKFETTVRQIYNEAQQSFIELKQEQLSLPIPAIANSGDYGYLNFPEDADNFIRRCTLLRRFQGQIYGSFALKILARYWGIDLGQTKFKPGSYIRLPNDKVIPLDEYNSTLINFVGPSGTIPTHSYYQVLKELVSPDEFEGKIVLIGPTFVDAHDVYPTPFYARYGESYGRKTSGVEIHASIVNTVLGGDFLKRVGRRWSFLIYTFLGTLALFFSLRFTPSKSLIIIFLEAVTFVIAGFFLFSWYNLWLDITSPLAEVGGVYMAVSIFRYMTEFKEKRQIKNVFQRYVSPEVVEQVLEDIEQVRLGGEKKHLTVLFADIRDFTTISEKYSPEEVVTQLNEYLNTMTEIIINNGGMLDKYVGDEIMAVFGAPIYHDEHPLLACKTALEMMDSLGELQQKWAREGRPLFNIGIGINSGEMVVGNMGSSQRMDYTVIGDSVNLGARLEGLNKRYGTNIIISEFTYQKVKGAVKVKDLGKATVKGKEKEINVYELLAV